MKSMREMAKQQKREEKNKETERKEKLIECVRNNPVIWNRFLSSHKERDSVEAAWNDVSSQTGINKKDAKSSWKYLKDQFRVNFHAISVKKSGQEYLEEGDISLVKWPFFKQMLFLKDTVTKRNTTSNVEPEPEATKVDESSNEKAVEEDLLAFQILSNLGRELPDNEVEVMDDDEGCEQPSTSDKPTSSNITTHTKSKKRKTAEQPNELDKEISAVEQLLKQSVSEEDDEEKFSKYLAVLLRRVGPKYKSRCEFKLIQTLHEFVEKTENEAENVAANINN